MFGMCHHCSTGWKHRENRGVPGTRVHCNLVGKGSVDLGHRWHRGGSAGGHMSLSHTHMMSLKNPTAEEQQLGCKWCAVYLCAVCVHTLDIQIVAKFAVCIELLRIADITLCKILRYR